MLQSPARAIGILLLALPAFAQFKTPSPGASIEQAAHASASSATPMHKAEMGPSGSSSSVLILSDTKRFNLQPYLDTTLPVLRNEWYAAIHQFVSKPEYRNGNVVAQFGITHDGEIRNSRITESSGEDDLDKAVTEALQNASPLPAIPKAIALNEVFMRFNFQYKGKKVPRGLRH